MGYETRLLIGESSKSSGNEIKCGEWVYKDGEAYRPLLKDEKGHYINTGRRRTYFMVYAMIDLCKCGVGSKLHTLNRVNKDELHYWFWYAGGNEMIEDSYCEKLKPVPIKDVLEALRKDMSSDNKYRRFKWAYALLKEMSNDPEELTVLLEGY